MAFKSVKIPGFPVFRYHVKTLRRSCEHFCFLGATVDVFAAAIHFEVFAVILIGKAAFAIGAVGVYLMHYEEAIKSGASFAPSFASES